MKRKVNDIFDAEIDQLQKAIVMNDAIKKHYYSRMVSILKTIKTKVVNEIEEIE